MSRDRQSFVEDVKKAYDYLGGLKSMEKHSCFKMSEDTDLEQSINSSDLFSAKHLVHVQLCPGYRGGSNE